MGHSAVKYVFKVRNVTYLLQNQNESVDYLRKCVILSVQNI